MEIFSLLINIPIPFVYEILDLGFIVFLSSFFVYLTVKCFKTKQISRLYLLLLILSLVPILGAVQAMIYYNQPFIYGILSERLKVLAIGGLLIVNFLEKGLITLEQIKKTVLYLAFLILVVLLFLNIFVPGSTMEEYDFVVNTASKGYRFKLNNSLIVILFFYSLIVGVEQNKIRYLGLVLIILFYLTFLYKARSLTLSIIIATAFYLVQRVKFYRLISFGVIFTVVSTFIFAVAFVFFNEQIIKIAELFSSALSVFIGGEVTDSSALSRYSQYEIASEGIAKHPFLGNGFLSSRFGGGLTGLYGYFYPSDIGWMGTLYLYGILGTAIYIIPFILTAYYSFKIKKLNKKVDAFASAMVYTMLYFFIHSTTAGFFVKKLGIIIFVFSMVYYYYYSLKLKEVTK
ncbi:MAG: hypothetical protein DWP98_11550 [Bacteroidetes bacterium]|nr:MAG: hypothetical protein DWP98_11550 [Bacteroidota bacterium]